MKKLVPILRGMNEVPSLVFDETEVRAGWTWLLRRGNGDLITFVCPRGWASLCTLWRKSLHHFSDLGVNSLALGGLMEE